jgi:hypothetical protein
MAQEWMHLFELTQGIALGLPEPNELDPSLHWKRAHKQVHLFELCGEVELVSHE